jgi:hypothetical protein
MKTTGVRAVFMGVLLDGVVAVTAVIVARATPVRLESADCMTGYVADARHPLVHDGSLRRPRQSPGVAAGRRDRSVVIDAVA